jgi:hypothetical protein
MSGPDAPRSAAAFLDDESLAVESVPAFRSRIRHLLADLEADRGELELAITDGAARRMLLAAQGVDHSTSDDLLRAEADELDRLIGDLRSALDAKRG